MKNPCPNSSTGKHTWIFTRNAQKGQITHGPSGSHGRFWIVGVYSCACGAVRTGKSNPNAPGADLRGVVDGLSGVRVAGVETHHD